MSTCVHSTRFSASTWVSPFHSLLSLFLAYPAAEDLNVPREKRRVLQPWPWVSPYWIWNQVAPSLTYSTVPRQGTAALVLLAVPDEASWVLCYVGHTLCLFVFSMLCLVDQSQGCYFKYITEELLKVRLRGLLAPLFLPEQEETSSSLTSAFLCPHFVLASFLESFSFAFLQPKAEIRVTTGLLMFYINSSLCVLTHSFALSCYLRGFGFWF
jgi:hypothetical protein